MTRVCLVNGSLRGAGASSLSFLRDVARRLGRAGAEVSTAAARSRDESTLRAVADADAVVIAFPLFVYSTSGGLTGFMEDFLAYRRDHVAGPSRPKLYAIVNSGFPDPVVGTEAVRVMRCFAIRAGFDYRFSLMIAGGLVTALTKRVPLLNPALKRGCADMAADIMGRPRRQKLHPRRQRHLRQPEDIALKPIIPQGMIIWMKNQYEKKFV